jgi:hypothetical protein
MDGRKKNPLCGAGEPLGDDAEGAQPWRCDRLRTDPRRGSSLVQVLLSIRGRRAGRAGADLTDLILSILTGGPEQRCE